MLGHDFQLGISLLRGWLADAKRKTPAQSHPARIELGLGSGSVPLWHLQRQQAAVSEPLLTWKRESLLTGPSTYADEFLLLVKMKTKPHL